MKQLKMILSELKARNMSNEFFFAQNSLFTVNTARLHYNKI